jgi:hypothetical protein
MNLADAYPSVPRLANAIRIAKRSQSLRHAKDYQAFEAAIIADYDVQSAVERELVLRLLHWHRAVPSAA